MEQHVNQQAEVLKKGGKWGNFICDRNSAAIWDGKLFHKHN